MPSPSASTNISVVPFVIPVEIASFETKQTGKGNIVLDAKASDHHGDLAIATAIALYLSSVAINMQHEYKLEGWYG